MIIRYSKERVILLYTVFFAVFADAIFGVLSLSGFGFIKLSLIYRLLILITFIILISKTHNFFSNYIKVILVLWLVSLINLVATNKLTQLFLDLQIFVKVLFPFAVYYILYRYLKYKEYTLMACQGISLFGLVAGVCFLISIVTGIGFQNYSANFFGISSFFYAGNDIGIALVLSLCFSWFLFLMTPNFKYSLTILLTSLALVFLGTRTGILGAVLVNFIYLNVFLFRRYPNSSFGAKMTYPKLIISAFLFILFFMIVNFVLDNLDLFAIQLERFGDVAQGNNPRAILIDQGMKYMSKRPLLEELLGSGTYYQLELAKSLLSTVAGRVDFNIPRASFELDTLDLYALYGYVLGGGIIVIHVTFLLTSIFNFLRKRDLLTFTVSISLGLFLFIGNLSGHGATSAQVGSLLGAIYFISRDKYKCL